VEPKLEMNVRHSSRAISGHFGPGRFTRSGHFLFTQQLRRLGEVHGHAARLILGELLVDRAALRLVVKVEVAERLPGRCRNKALFKGLLNRG
jgi:hypothetical protein